MTGFAETAAPRPTEWLGGKTWAYSITFDEALTDLHRFSVPMLEEYGVPGHVEVVVGHMGTVRNIGQSSYNGFTHMNPEQLRDLLDRGWGVGNHSWSHQLVNEDTVELELGKAREVLQDAIGAPVTVYCSPGNNHNMNPGALAGCRTYGYLGAMSITDALNRPDDDDLLWLNRTFLHDQSNEPFFSEFDPFRKIPHAKRDRGWIIDYLHCPMETVVHPQKDVSQAQLRERLETVIGEGGDEVWLAKVEEPMDYRYARRALRITAGGDAFDLRLEGLPAEVAHRTLTFEVPGEVTVDGAPAPTYQFGGRTLVDVDLTAPRSLRFAPVPELRGATR